MKNFHVALLLCCAAFLSACQQPTTPATSSFNELSLTVGDPQAIAESDSANRRVRALLKKPLTMTLEGNKLVDLVDALQKEIGVPVHVNWAALEAAGVEQDLAMSTKAIQGISGDAALRIIIEIAGAGAQLEPVDYAVRDGLVAISTRRDLNKGVITRIYDIRDLIEPVPTVPRSMGFEEADINIRLRFPFAEAETLLFADDDYERRDTKYELIEQITSLIQDTVGYQSEWVAYGGEVSSLREFDGDLIINTTPIQHEEIEQLMTALRRTRAKAKLRHQEQWKKLNVTRVPELVEQLRRMEKKFDEFNAEYEKTLEAEKNAKEGR